MWGDVTSSNISGLLPINIYWECFATNSMCLCLSCATVLRKIYSLKQELQNSTNKKHTNRKKKKSKKDKEERGAEEEVRNKTDEEGKSMLLLPLLPLPFPILSNLLGNLHRLPAQHGISRKRTRVVRPRSWAPVSHRGVSSCLGQVVGNHFRTDVEVSPNAAGEEDGDAWERFPVPVKSVAVRLYGVGLFQSKILLYRLLFVVCCCYCRAKGVAFLVVRQEMEK